MDTVLTLAPFKGSLKDFKSFWQNVIDEAWTNKSFWPFINKYCPDSHRDLHSQVKLWKECHDQAVLMLSSECHQWEEVDADIASLCLQVSDTNAAVLCTQVAKSLALGQARQTHDHALAAAANFEESRHTDLSALQNLRDQLAQAQRTNPPEASNKLQARYLVLLNSHPSPQDAIGLLLSPFHQSFTDLLATNTPRVAPLAPPPAPTQVSTKPQFPPDVTYRGQVAPAAPKKKAKKAFVSAQEEAQIIAKLTSTVSNAWPTLPQQDAVAPPPSSSPPKTLTFRQKETNRGSMCKPSSQGTNEAELHMAIPHSEYTSRIFSAHGADLLTRIADIV